MWHTICRTAFSLIVSEAQDFACDLLDAQGESLAHSPRAMPVFNLCLPRTVKALLAKYPPETLRPGDELRLVVEPLRSGAPGGAWNAKKARFRDGRPIVAAP